MRLTGSNFFRQTIYLRLTLAGKFPCFLLLCDFSFFFSIVRFLLFQICVPYLKLHSLLQFSLKDFQPVFGLADTIGKDLLRILVFENHIIQKFDCLICRQLSLFGSHYFQICGAGLVAFDAAQILLYAFLSVRAFTVEISGLLLELFLKDLVILRLEYLPENSLSFLRSRKEQLQEIALCDHGNLSELTAVNSQNFLYLVPDLTILGHDLAARKRQFHFCLLGGEPLSS